MKTKEEVEQLRWAKKVADSIVGYRADIDRCLVEIRHKNDVIKQLDNALEEARRERDALHTLLGRAAFELESSGVCSNSLAQDICIALAWDATKHTKEKP